MLSSDSTQHPVRGAATPPLSSGVVLFQSFSEYLVLQFPTAAPFASASPSPLSFLVSHPMLCKEPVLCAARPFEVCPCCLFFSSLQRHSYTQKHKPLIKTCRTVSDHSAHSKEDCCLFSQWHWCQLGGNSPCICRAVSVEGQLLSSPFSMASHMLCVAFQLCPPKSVGRMPHWKQSLVCCGWGLQ